MLTTVNKLIAIAVGMVLAVALARAGYVSAASVVAVLGLLAILPTGGLWQRLYGGPPRHVDVAVEYRAACRANAVEFSLMTPVDGEFRRALADLAEGCGIPASSLSTEEQSRETVRVTSSAVDRSDAWETLARMGSRLPGVREVAAVGEGAEGVVTRWRFRDAAFVNESS